MNGSLPTNAHEFQLPVYLVLQHQYQTTYQFDLLPGIIVSMKLHWLIASGTNNNWHTTNCLQWFLLKGRGGGGDMKFWVNNYRSCSSSNFRIVQEESCSDSNISTIARWTVYNSNYFILKKFFAQNSLCNGFSYMASLCTGWIKECHRKTKTKIAKSWHLHLLVQP